MSDTPIDKEFDASQELIPEVVEPPREPPPPELVDAVLHYYSTMRDDLARRIGVLEDLVGFIRSSSELTTRVAKLEAFMGVKA